MNGATICLAQGTTHELTIADWFRARNLTFKPLVIENQESLYQAYFSGRCDALTQRLDRRSPPPNRRAPPIPTTMPSCRTAFRRSRWGRWCAMATTSGSTSCAGP